MPMGWLSSTGSAQSRRFGRVSRAKHDLFHAIALNRSIRTVAHPQLRGCR
jgi:hypothetical protein